MTTALQSWVPQQEVVQTEDMSHPSRRLVIQKYKEWWWPGVFYNDLEEFNTMVSPELDRTQDYDTKGAFALKLLESLKQATATPGNESGDQGYIRFLGRPVSEFHKVQERSYLDFCLNLTLVIQQVRKPELFGREQHDLYIDFHRACDEATDMLQPAMSKSPNQNDGNTWTFKAQIAWEQQQQHQQQPNSPMANYSVAAVSLAEESFVSTATPRTVTTTASSPPQEQQPESPAVQSPPPLEEGTSPIKKFSTWDDVWAKLCYAGWASRMERPLPRIYTSPAPHSREFDEQELLDYVRQKHGWVGERRMTTRNLTAPNCNNPSKHYTFGVLWKQHLEPNGWTMIKPKGSGPIEYHYVRPGKSVADGTEGVDYFISMDAVMKYCHQHQEYPESSSSEGELSSPEQPTPMEEDIETDDGKDDESTKAPAEMEDAGSMSYHTTPNQPTRPQDPAQPQSATSTLEDDDEEVRYRFKNLWNRLKQEGWKWPAAKNGLDSNWYVPPPKLNMDAVVPVKEMVRGEHYFVQENEVVEYIRRLDGCPATDQEAPSQEGTRQRTRGRASRPQEQETQAANSINKQAKANKSTISKGQKRQPKKGDSSKKSNKKSRPNPKVEIRVKDINVKVDGDHGSAPWERNPLPKQLHGLLLSAGVPYSSGYYYLPNESVKSCTARFPSPHEFIQHCGTVGGMDLEVLSEEDRPSVERLLAYANVPEKQSAWRNIRAITTEETMSFLGLLGYEEASDGSYKIPAGMSKYLFKETYPSLSSLIEALRRASELYTTAAKRRRGSGGDLLTKEQMLALRLRIAEGLDGETWTTEVEESTDNDSEDQEDMDTISEEEFNEEEEVKPQETESEEEPEEELEEQNNLESSGMEDQEEDSDAIDEKELEDRMLTEVGKLRDSNIHPSVAWKNLIQLGCTYSGSYSVPNGKDRFGSMQDLVHYILLNSVTVLDFTSNPLSRAALKRFHRWLKFSFVKLTSTEAVVKALENLSNGKTIIESLLEKIGFTRTESLYYRHENSTETFDLGQVINTIRAQREDLLQIGQEGRSRQRKTLAIDEDVTLRLWAAEANVPLQFFDEEIFCAEARKVDEEVITDDEEEYDNDLPPEKGSSTDFDGEKVLDVEEAIDSSSSSNAFEQSPENASTLFQAPLIAQGAELEQSRTSSVGAENEREVEEEDGATTNPTVETAPGEASVEAEVAKKNSDEEAPREDTTPVQQRNGNDGTQVADVEVDQERQVHPLTINQRTQLTKPAENEDIQQAAEHREGTEVGTDFDPQAGLLTQLVETKTSEVSDVERNGQDTESVQEPFSSAANDDSQDVVADSYTAIEGLPLMTQPMEEDDDDSTTEETSASSLLHDEGDDKAMETDNDFDPQAGLLTQLVETKTSEVSDVERNGQDTQSVQEPFSSAANDDGQEVVADSYTAIEGLSLMTQPMEEEDHDSTTEDTSAMRLFHDEGDDKATETDNDFDHIETPSRSVAPTGVETERSPDIKVLLRQLDNDPSMQLYCDESSQQNDEMVQSFMTPEQGYDWGAGG
jgi:hypothetical protein